MTLSTLAGLLDSLDDLEDNLTVYASSHGEWQAESLAVAATEPDDGSIPPEASGMTYLLEVPLAKEAIRVWSEWRGGATPTTADRVEAVVHFAKHDAFLPVRGA